MRSPGGRHVVAGAEAVDLRPPELNRRGAARRRAEELSGQESFRDPACYLRRVGYARLDDLDRDGFDTAATPAGIIAFRDWWIAASQVTWWKHALTDTLHAHTAAHPLAPGMPRKAAMDALGLQEEGLLGLAIAAAKAESSEECCAFPGSGRTLARRSAGSLPSRKGLRQNPLQPRGR